jgi:hypothetical protein
MLFHLLSHVKVSGPYAGFSSRRLFTFKENIKGLWGQVCQRVAGAKPMVGLCVKPQAAK